MTVPGRELAWDIHDQGREALSLFMGLCLSRALMKTRPELYIIFSLAINQGHFARFREGKME